MHPESGFKDELLRDDFVEQFFDVTQTLESHGIGWTMWDYSGGFSVVNGENGHHSADEIALKALGLKR
jgi:hypothetical protein